MAKPLTIQLIQQKTKTDSLVSIKNLNLWGNDLDDLKALRQLPNLEVLSLSVNRISTLKDISSCSKLKELYLRKNEIDDINELRYIQHLPNLKVLWLQDNPCSETQHYRYIVIRYLPNLEKLDNLNVTEQDRATASRIQLPEEKESEEQTSFEQPAVRPSTAYREQYQTPKEEENQVLRGSQINQYQQQMFQQQKVVIKQELSQQPQHQQQVNNYQQQSTYGEPDDNIHNVDYALLNNQLKQQDGVTQHYEKNENILCAVLALLKEMDEYSLEVVKREIERKQGLLRNSRKN